MKIASTHTWLACGCLLTLQAVFTVQAGSVPDEQSVIYTAAGFTREADGRYVRCREDPPTMSYQPGRIEYADLNGDGRDEAFVRESSLFCYGNTAEFFVLLTRGEDGWRTLLEDTGIPVVLETRHQGWPDIEVGGPGFGSFPVYRWNGNGYEVRD